jgi:hypothetical protein
MSMRFLSRLSVKKGIRRAHRVRAALPAVEVLENRIAPANTDYWVGGGGDNSWYNPANWKNGLPGAADSVVIDTTSTTKPTIEFTTKVGTKYMPKSVDRRCGG